VAGTLAEQREGLQAALGLLVGRLVGRAWVMFREAVAALANGI
jgi:hypothetical protein